MLLKDKLYFIFKNFDSTGKKFLIKLAKDEKKIDYNNLFFEINYKSVVKSADFLKEIGTWYDLLIYLLDNFMRIATSAKTQIDFSKAITTLKIIISNLKTDITDQSEEQKKKFFAKQENVLSNAEMLLKKRGELIDQFWKNNIISMGKNFMVPLKRKKKAYQRNQNKNLIN